MVESIYIHIPLCKTKCTYCNFYSIAKYNQGTIGRLKTCIFNEINLKSIKTANKTTLYFGGGTPSIMDREFFELVVEKYSDSYENTIEVNPEDVTHKYLVELRSAGINRISIGVQTFNDRLLKILGRNYTQRTAIYAIETCLSVFNNVSIDMMYAIPSQSIKDIEEDFSFITKFTNLKHISIYGLTIYRKTPIYKLINNKALKEISEDVQRTMYYTYLDFLTHEGFEQYEISNFAKKGYECRHNLTYWNFDEYIGFGPSAASFTNGKYSVNHPDITNYIKKLLSNQVPPKKETTFSKEEIIKMKILMGLRKTKGINLKKLDNLNEIFKETRHHPRITNLLDEEFIDYDSNTGILKVNKKGYFVLESIENIIVDELFPK